LFFATPRPANTSLTEGSLMLVKGRGGGVPEGVAIVMVAKNDGKIFLWTTTTKEQQKRRANK
jgi:hypothetical protein